MQEYSIPLNYFPDQVQIHLSSLIVNAQPQTDTSHYHSIIKILTAGTLSLYNTNYWNFKEDVCLTALYYIGKLAMYGMPDLVSFIAQLSTASSYTAQCVTS